MRMRRWVKTDLDVEGVYMPFARQILEALAHLPLVLAMDGSQAGRGCMVLMMGVLYQKRALPIAWLVYKGKKGHTNAAPKINSTMPIEPPPNRHPLEARLVPAPGTQYGRKLGG